MKTNVIPFVYKDDLFFRAEYNEDAKVFEVLGPSKPHPNGGTSREVVQIFMDEDCEADALSLARILNKQCLPLMREVASLTAEVAQLREELETEKKRHADLNGALRFKWEEIDALQKELAQLRTAHHANELLAEELAQVKAERDELMKEGERKSELLRAVDDDSMVGAIAKRAIENDLRATVTSQAATIEALKAELEAERKIVNPLFSLEIGDGSWVTTDSIAIIEKSKELGLFGHVSESKNPFSCGGVPLQRVHFSK